MSKFKRGDRIVGVRKKDAISLKHNTHGTRYHGVIKNILKFGEYRLIIDHPNKKGETLDVCSDGLELELDVQYYREERLNEILNKK